MFVRCGARAEAQELARANLRLASQHYFAAGFPLALLGEPTRALELLADSPRWAVDIIFQFEQETAGLRRHAGFERLLRQLNATEAWQLLCPVSEKSTVTLRKIFATREHPSPKNSQV